MELRDLPSVDEVLRELGDNPGGPRDLVVATIRQVLEDARAVVKAGGTPPGAASEVRRRLSALGTPTLRRVINATGVVLHTNLGRAPLGALSILPGYSNLEYDIETGKRGKRDAHLTPLLEALLGVPAIAVNNNAAAVYLALHELAQGGEAIVSRGELIEIGDGFRIPDIMARSGAIIREVGTTNKTSLDDYRAAIGDRTRLILRVHPSNFHIEGFTAKPRLDELAALAREHGVPLYEDLGSGCLVDLEPYGIREPLVRESLEAGVDLVSFSCDKLLGGPQTGILAGRPELVARIRRNPMFRAFRCDKLICEALAGTLRRTLFERYEEIPALRMITESAAHIRERAERLAAELGDCEVVAGESVIGGGSTPDQSISTWLVTVAGKAAGLERSLRLGSPAVIARLQDDRLVIDLRTVAAEEEAELIAAIRQARSR